MPAELVENEPKVAITMKVSPTSRKIMRMAKAVFDMDYSEIVDTALREYAQRHGMRDRVVELGNSMKGGGE